MSGHDPRELLRQVVLDEGGETWDDLDEYLDEVCGFGVDRLSRESDVLTGECVRLQKQLEAVACGNYRALIESFECAGAVREGVAAVHARLDTLVGDLPKLADSAKQFRTRAVKAEGDRQRAVRTLTEHSRILELAELPKLMLTLVRGEMYDEALELGAYVAKIGMMHSDLPAIERLAGEVERITVIMVQQLLVVLRSSIQLPVCLRVMGFLRRLSVYSELDLRHTFLQCRGQWMRTSLQATSAAPTPQGRLVRLSDDTRAIMFEIITQYRAVFPDDEESDRHAKVLHDWTLACISDYLRELELQLDQVAEGASLATVLQQAMYCGQSLGRVGADFRPLLPPLFEDAVLRLLGAGLHAAITRFEVSVEDYRWAPLKNSSEAVNTADDGDPFAPPTTALDFPPVAVFLNGILVSLNELRNCAPVPLRRHIASKIEECLMSCLDILRRVGGNGANFLEREERQQFLSMVSCLRDAVFPHVLKCIEACLGRQAAFDLSRLQMTATALLTPY